MDQKWQLVHPIIKVDIIEQAGHTRIYSLGVDSYQYAWDVDPSGGAPSDGNYRATVAGADLAGNAYSEQTVLPLLSILHHLQ